MTIDIQEMKRRLEARKAEIKAPKEDLSLVEPEADPLIDYKEEVEEEENNNEDYVGDTEDAAVDAQELLQEEAIEANEQSLLMQINDALKRIDDGTYGLCVVDKKPIPEKRLEAMPWAARCAEHEAEWERLHVDDDAVEDDSRETHYS